MAPVRRRDKNTVTLRPVRPNAGIEAEYRRRLTGLVQEMAASVEYWLRAKYRANAPRIAQDELPAEAMRRAIRSLSRRWQSRFDTAAKELAAFFAQSVSQRSDAQLRLILKKAGFTVRFTMTRAQQDILRATINENVALIKSIPSQYFTQIEGAVMRSVTAGRDVGALAKELQSHYGVSRRRAAFIARDQNSKATSSLNRARRIELGLFDAEWAHGGGGHVPRPTHLKAGRDRVRYDVREGWLDPAVGTKIQPGQLPNCRCYSRPVVGALQRIAT